MKNARFALQFVFPTTAHACNMCACEGFDHTMKLRRCFEMWALHCATCASESCMHATFAHAIF